MRMQVPTPPGDLGVRFGKTVSDRHGQSFFCADRAAGVSRVVIDKAVRADPLLIMAHIRASDQSRQTTPSPRFIPKQDPDIAAFTVPPGIIDA